MKNKLNKKIMIIIGTRPEAIKLAPVIKELNENPNYKLIVCATAQHRELLDQMLKTFKIGVHFDLNLMSKNQSMVGFFQEALWETSRIMIKTKPDMVIIQGDTSTAAAGALASFYNKIPVSHVEAGLRSGDMKNPFPEEVNRILTDNLSDLLFVPTKQSKMNLIKEGFTRGKIHVTGNTVVDTLKYNIKGLKNNKALLCCSMKKWDKIILVTLHRRESFGKDMKNIFAALLDIVKQNEKILIIYPVHPNPNVQEMAYKTLRHKQIMLFEPLPYLPFLSLMNQSDLIITDSGGVQEEAPALEKFVIVARKKTERMEGVDKGCVFLTGPSRKKIVKTANGILSTPRKFSKDCKNIYGDGKASKRIAKAIDCFF
ncbi:MAG: UDP-N-acetylglucosamine 2-epimerase (non-hydrolyzing), partial [Elusimicrobiota bacterium]|nr:UDP-N-acetylglucosamine 2-epimerase (non-hydrolyzing) [Elusimicrobiota bacterium]